MIDESTGITLNIASLPVTKKKTKKTNTNVLASQTSVVKSKPRNTESHKKNDESKALPKPVSCESVGILKKPVSAPCKSIWKKFKQSHIKGNVKPGFVKSVAKPAKLMKKKVKVKDKGESSDLTTVKTVSFLEDNTDSLETSEIDFQGKFQSQTKFENKKSDVNHKTFPFLNSTSDQNDAKPKKQKTRKNFSDGDSTPSFKKTFDNDQNKGERNTGKKTSLFGNNPGIPNIPHRAVKPIKEAVFSNMCFEDLGIHPYMVKNLKESLGLSTMTTVQEKSIPVLLKKNDALIRSQTGSGKTLAYALPILQELQGIIPKINRSDGVLVLIVVPTRELALQTYEVFNKLVKSYTWIVPGYLVGGEKRKSEKARLRKGISILIGTPGRLIDHIQHTKCLKLDKVKWLVIDEADRLLDMGYEKDVSMLLDALNQNESSLLRPSYLEPEERIEKQKNIEDPNESSLLKPSYLNFKKKDSSEKNIEGQKKLNLLKPSYLNTEERKKQKNVEDRQTVLLSATLTQKVEKLAGLSLKNPVFIDACSENVNSLNHVPVFGCDVGGEVEVMVLPESLVQLYVVTPPKLKLVTLTSFILWKSQLTKQKKMLIFVATQDMVDYYTQLLSSVFSSSKEDDSDEEDSSFFSNSGIELFKLHGNMKQNERTEVFKTFRKSHLGVLLCTDVASRGLDLPEVDWVIQYTGPTSVSDYVHRVGRTARGGQSGSSIIFLTPNEVSFIGKLENCQIRLQEEKMENCLNHLMSLKPRGSSVPEEATNLQSVFENMVTQDSKLYDLACKAYASWCRFYASYPRNMRDAFSVKTVHQGHYAKSFALRDTPSVIVSYARKKNLNEERFTRKRPRERKDTEKGKGFYGKSRFAHISEFDSGLEPLPKKPK